MKGVTVSKSSLWIFMFVFGYPIDFTFFLVRSTSLGARRDVAKLDCHTAKLDCHTSHHWEVCCWLPHRFVQHHWKLFDSIVMMMLVTMAMMMLMKMLLMMMMMMMMLMMMMMMMLIMMMTTVMMTIWIVKLAAEHVWCLHDKVFPWQWNR